MGVVVDVSPPARFQLRYFDNLRLTLTVHRHGRHHQRHLGPAGFVVADGRQQQVILWGGRRGQRSMGKAASRSANSSSTSESRR